MKKRAFEQMSHGQKLSRLLKLINLAIQENTPKKWRTDIWGIAKQYGGNEIRVTDFDLIKKMTIEELANAILSDKEEDK